MTLRLIIRLNQNTTREHMSVFVAPRKTMQKVTVFGKPGGGKSTLSRNLSAATGIELFPLDLIEYEQNGERVAKEIYHQRHAELIASDAWIIEGLGTLQSFWDRIDAADTVVYIDLPYRVHYWWVVKRLLKSPFVKPLGWPKGSSVWKGTVAGFKYLRLSRKFWTLEMFEKIQERAANKDVFRVTSVKELNEFVGSFRSQ